MGKSRRSSSGSQWGLARTLAMLGGVVALVGFGIGFVQEILNDVNLIGMLYQFLGIFVSILVLFQVGLIKGKMNIPLNWWMLLIFVVLQAIFAGLVSIVSIAGLGILLEVIAVILLLINAM